MHYKFRARLQGHSETIQILVSKNMAVSELIDALAYALQIQSPHQIVGFRDPHSGLIVTPTIVCADPE